MDKAVFDYVVVGAGTAGCLLANRLSADPAVRVLLIEAGGSDRLMWIRIPVGYLYCIGNPRTDWCFKTEPQAGLNGRSLGYPRGKVLGGSSSINGMIYMRGQREDYDGWRDGDGHGANPGWGWDDVLPKFLQHEDHHGGANAWHASGGRWRVERQRLSWRILESFRAAAAEQGIAPVDDFNRGDNLGSSYFEVNQRRGTRWNAARAFLEPVLRRPNLTVWTGAVAQRLRLDGGSCTGLRVLRASGPGQRGPGSGVDVEARAGVVLAAGAVATPQLLQVSGIGPADHLASLGIAPICALPGVGANLQDHLQLRLAYRVRGVRTLNTLSASVTGRLAMALQYALQRRGPLTMAPSQLGAFACSDPAQPRANLQYHVQPLSLDRFGEPLHGFDAFTASVCNLRPASRGSVMAVSTDIAHAPRIDPNYLSTDDDRRIAAESIRLTRRIAASSALAEYSPEEFRPGPQAQSEDELVRAAGDVGTTIFHPVGTAKMGPAGDPTAVVDARLRVHGVDRLWVADASIMPTITSGNTNSPTLMIAEQAAAFIVQRG